MYKAMMTIKFFQRSQNCYVYFLHIYIFILVYLTPFYIDITFFIPIFWLLYEQLFDTLYYNFLIPFPSRDHFFILRQMIPFSSIDLLYTLMTSSIYIAERNQKYYHFEGMIKRSAREKNLPFLICIIFSHKNVVWKPATRRRWNQFKCIFLARQ